MDENKVVEVAKAVKGGFSWKKLAIGAGVAVLGIGAYMLGRKSNESEDAEVTDEPAEETVDNEPDEITE